MKRCECDRQGKLKREMKELYNTYTELPFVNHKPNECKYTNELQLYIRNGKKMWLCSCCCMFGDKLVEENDENET